MVFFRTGTMFCVLLFKMGSNCVGLCSLDLAVSTRLVLTSLRSTRDLLASASPARIHGVAMTAEEAVL